MSEDPSLSAYLVYLAAVAGLLHASLQLPVASLLHMVVHSLGKNQRGKAAALSIAMGLGVFLSVALILVVTSSALWAIPDEATRRFLAGGAMVLAGLFVMFRYFRDTPGAQLWLARRTSRWLHQQIETIAGPLGAFGIGMVAILLELPLSLPLLLGAGAVLAAANPATTLTSLATYAGLVTLPLLLTGLALATGANPLSTQRWRITGKRFWQFFTGLAIILFGLYVMSGQFAGGTT